MDDVIKLKAEVYDLIVEQQIYQIKSQNLGQEINKKSIAIDKLIEKGKK